MARAEDMLEFVRQCASVAQAVAREARGREDDVAFALATLYDGLMEAYEGGEGGADSQ